MPDKKQTEAEKEKARMAAMRRLAAYQKSSRQPSKKKPVEKKKESWVARLKKKVRKHFDKKKKFETARTKQTKEQLRKAGLSEADIAKLQGKKKK